MKPRQPAESDFGYEETEGNAAYARACIVRSLRISEITLRKRGKLDLADGYRQLADAIEAGFVREEHDFQMTALYLGLHSYNAEGVRS